jgi:hypothetical protein
VARGGVENTVYSVGDGAEVGGEGEDMMDSPCTRYIYSAS